MGRARRKGDRLTFPEQLERVELKRGARHARSLKPGQCPEPSQPAGTDLLPQIKHIVVLMMENHSYDNYLGMLDGRGEGFPRNGDGELDVTNLDAEGTPVPSYRMRSTMQTEDVPCQSWHATHAH